MSQKMVPHPKKDVLASEPSIMETHDSICIIKPVISQNIETFGSIASEFNYKEPQAVPIISMAGLTNLVSYFTNDKKPPSAQGFTHSSVT